MHCLIEFHDNPTTTIMGKDIDSHWAIIQLDCPACKRMNLFLISCGAFYDRHTEEWHITEIFDRIAIRPQGSSRPPCPTEVPTIIAEDYLEACRVLPYSPKASAALSRRCLQNLLRETAKVKHGNLANEIQEVIDKGGLPSYIIEVIDAVRNIGNFAAHPMKSDSTGQIVPVEPHEAEWTLDVLEALFDFYYVQPAIIAKKRADLNAKLQEVKKPPIK
jgi:hypothetical protein